MSGSRPTSGPPRRPTTSSSASRRDGLPDLVETPVADPTPSGTGAPAGSRRLTVNRTADGIALTGVIDESASLPELLPGAPGRLRIDLAGVTFINSLGVREWIRFLATAAQTGVKVELARVSEPLIQQLNMIVAARG